MKAAREIADKGTFANCQRLSGAELNKMFKYATNKTQRAIDAAALVSTCCSAVNLVRYLRACVGGGLAAERRRLRRRAAPCVPCPYCARVTSRIPGGATEATSAKLLSVLGVEDVPA